MAVYKEDVQVISPGIVSVGDTVHRRRIDLSLGLDLLSNLGRRLVSGSGKQTTLKQTASNVTWGLGLLSRLRRDFLVKLGAVEESAVHRPRLELLLNLLHDLRVGLKGGLLTHEGRVGLVCHLDNTRLNLLDRTALITILDLLQGILDVVGDCVALALRRERIGAPARTVLGPRELCAIISLISTQMK